MLAPVCFPKSHGLVTIFIIRHNYDRCIPQPWPADKTLQRILIIGLVQLQVLENWFEVYVEQILLHSICRGLEGLKIGPSGFSLGMIRGLKNRVAGEKPYLIFSLIKSAIAFLKLSIF